MSDACRRPPSGGASHGFDLDFANLIYLGDRNEPARLPGGPRLALTRQSVAELLAANGLPPLDEDERAFRQLRRAAVRERHTQAST